MAAPRSASQLENGRKPPRACEVVYFVRAVSLNLVKIGIARDFRVRITALQVGSPDKLELLGVVRCPDPAKLERDLHGRFARERSHGEWFRYSSRLQAYVAKNSVSADQDDLNRYAQAYKPLGIEVDTTKLPPLLKPTPSRAELKARTDRHARMAAERLSAFD